MSTFTLSSPRIFFWFFIFFFCTVNAKNSNAESTPTLLICTNPLVKVDNCSRYVPIGYPTPIMNKKTSFGLQLKFTYCNYFFTHGLPKILGYDSTVFTTQDGLQMMILSHQWGLSLKNPYIHHDYMKNWTETVHLDACLDNWFFLDWSNT